MDDDFRSTTLPTVTAPVHHPSHVAGHQNAGFVRWVGRVSCQVMSCHVRSCLMCHVIGVMSFLVPLLVTSCLLSLVSCYLSHVGSCFMCHVICVMSLLMCHDKLIPVSRHVMSWLMCHVTSYVSCYLYHVMSCLFLFDMLSVSCHFFCVMIPVSRQVFYVSCYLSHDMSFMCHVICVMPCNNNVY